MATDNSNDDKTNTYIILTKGTMVSHYRIVEKIGAGGMGEVYLAEDTKLKRQVALKFIPSQYVADADFKARFVQEAEAMAKLNHPNIITIHEVSEHHGRPFIAMELVEGQSLRDLAISKDIGLDRIVELAIQICDGLNAAHEKKIIHRDIKPSNIVIDAYGRPKILDFGLAAIQGGVQLTKTGSTLGTVRYMSPEQAKGIKMDYRSDLFSLGIVLFELIAGRTPHTSQNDAGTLNKIINDAPEPLARYKSDVPQELQRIVSKCLAKSPDERYQSAADLTADLRAVGSALTSGISSSSIQTPDTQPSIAVLPFANMSADPENEFFADGLTEELLNVLAKNPELKVTGRTSSFAFKGKQEDLREIGNKLGVKTILEGSVRKAGNRVRITAQLVKTSDGFHLWSETYDRILDDIFAVQDEIAQAVAIALKVKLLSKLGSEQTVNPESYVLVLRANQLAWKLTKSTTAAAVNLYQEAIGLDPENAHAWAGLAMALVSQAAFGFEDTLDTYRKGKKAAQKAIELDGSLAKAYVAMGWVRGSFEYHLEEETNAYQKAYELSPNDVFVLGHLSITKGLSGHFEEAIQLSRQAIDLDPLNQITHMLYGKVLSWAGQFSKAVQVFQRALELSPGMVSINASISLVYLQQDQLEDAFLAAEQETGNGYKHSALALIYHAMGKKEESDRALDNLLDEGGWGYQIATVYAYRSELDKAFEWLDKSSALKDAGITGTPTSAFFTNLHSDPRWPAFLKRIGFTGIGRS